jgi:spore coat polysaccharide biosynthesis protein SpsF
MKIGIISQARMTSTRLPAKILLTVLDKPLLLYHVNRLKMSEVPIYIATTSNQTDDIVEKFCVENHLPFFRGSESDVLSRYFYLAEREKLDVIVRVTSDCPLIDGYEIKKALAFYTALPNYKNVYYTNCQKRTFPRGFDFEIFSFESLKKCFDFGTLEFEREHVTPYIWKTHPEQFDILHYLRDEDCSRFRITVDEEDDFKLIKILIEKYSAHTLNSAGIIDILKAHPELSAINEHVEQKKV